VATGIRKRGAENPERDCFSDVISLPYAIHDRKWSVCPPSSRRARDAAVPRHSAQTPHRTRTVPFRGGADGITRRLREGRGAYRSISVVKWRMVEKSRLRSNRRFWISAPLFLYSLLPLPPNLDEIRLAVAAILVWHGPAAFLVLRRHHREVSMVLVNGVVYTVNPRAQGERWRSTAA